MCDVYGGGSNMSVVHMYCTRVPLTMGRKTSAAPFTVAMYLVSEEPRVYWAQMTDILLRLLEKWNRWMILRDCFLSLRELTESPDKCREGACHERIKARATACGLKVTCTIIQSHPAMITNTEHTEGM